MFTILITFLSAISISVIAAGYSIVGLSTLFAGAVVPIIAMGSALEVGKLVAASWLYNNWRNKLVPYTIKMYLTFAVIVLIFITSMGIFGFLSKAHLDQVKPTSSNNIKIELIDKQINQQQLIIDRAEGQLTLLAKDLEGYKNLMKLISHANTHGKRNKECLISIEVLKENKDGLIMFTGGLKSQIANSVLADKFDLAEKQARFFKDIFQENFFLEITRVGFENEDKCNNSLIEISKSSDIPLIASNRVRFLNQNDFESHETRVSIQSGYVLSDPRRKRDYQENQYLKSFEEMQKLFNDIPEAIDNAYEVSKKCNLEIKTGIYVLPDFETPDELKESEYLRKLSEKGILEKTKLNNLKELPLEYLDRFNYELDTILEMGYEGYFLIVADFVNWAKDNDVPVGPGRGSGAGSLIAYALGITGLDPMKYDLLFERFLNPDRISNPDFDIDFCRDGREKVIEYVTNKYGKHAVAQICTFGTMAARAVVRDVARAQGKSYSLGDKIAKLIPFSPEMTLERAIKESKDLKQILKILVWLLLE